MTQTTEERLEVTESEWTEADVMRLYRERCDQIVALWTPQADHDREMYKQVIEPHGREEPTVCHYPRLPFIRSHSPEDALAKNLTELAEHIAMFLDALQEAKATEPQRWEPLPTINVPTEDDERIESDPPINITTDERRELVEANPEFVKEYWGDKDHDFHDIPLPDGRVAIPLATRTCEPKYCCHVRTMDYQRAISDTWQVDGDGTEFNATLVDEMDPNSACHIEASIYGWSWEIDSDRPGREFVRLVRERADELARKYLENVGEAKESDEQPVEYQVTAIHIYERGKYLRTVGNLTADQAIGYKASHESRHPDRELVIETREMTAAVPSVLGEPATETVRHTEDFVAVSIYQDGRFKECVGIKSRERAEQWASKWGIVGQKIVLTPCPVSIELPVETPATDAA